MGLSHLKDTPPFDILPEEIVKKFRDCATEQTFAADSYIFRQNAPPTGFLYVIQQGMVEITATVPGGQEMVVDYRKPGQFFGATPIFTEEPYTGGARAVTATSCFLIPRDILVKTADDYPQLHGYFSRIILSRVRSLYSEIVKENSVNALTQMEAYPFRKRLSEIMHSPVATCELSTTAHQIARIMTEKKISSLVVVDEQDNPCGIITEKDLVSKVLATDQGHCETSTAAGLMSNHQHAMSPSAYMYEALNYMTVNEIKHLPVIDAGQLVGIITLPDLMRFRSQKAMLMVGSIGDVNNFEELARIKCEILTVARALLTETHSTPEVLEIISYIHTSILKKIYALCFDQLLASGLKPPKVDYAFLLMGSGGRHEMLLNPDQDHGFVFEDYPDHLQPEVDAFFGPFSQKLVDACAYVGYPLCHGLVMANNPAWRGRLRDWQLRIQDWINNPEPQKVRYSSIFFDFIGLEGNTKLVDSLHQLVFAQIRDYRRFLYHMMTLDQNYRVPLGLLGRFLLEKEGEHKGQLSIKQGGTLFIVDCIRMFALEKELTQTSTLARLAALTDQRVFEIETAEHIKAAFEALTFLRLRQEISLLEQGQSGSHYLDPHQLTKGEQELLKESFNAVSKLQDATKRHFTKSFI